MDPNCTDCVVRKIRARQANRQALWATAALVVFWLGVVAGRLL